MRVVLDRFMRLDEGQVWKLDEGFVLIVVWERLAIEYQELATVEATEGVIHRVTKKEFCRLIKNAEMVRVRSDDASGDGE